jgi:Putative 8-oxoguanine DNA glycosylase OGG-like protein
MLGWKAGAGRSGMMRIVADLPPPVAAAATARARQRGIPWSRSRWKQALPAYAHLLDELPPRLDRATVRRACERAEPHEALVTTMAWGFAKTGYGPHRVQKMLLTDGLHDRLATVLHALDELGPLEAYRLLGGACRIVELGPAFGTKFLFFHDESALILDAIIGGWFRAATGEDLRVTQWRPGLYERYLAQMETGPRKRR